MRFRRPRLRWLGELSKVTRLSIYRECVASIPLAVMTGVLGSSFCGFVGRKALQMSDGMLATVMACQMAGLLLAGLLVGFFHHKRKITVLAWTLFLASLVLLSISLTPGSEHLRQLGSLAFLIQIFLAQIGIALMTTLRTSVWRNNYPAEHRGKIIVIIYFVITAGNSLSVFGFTAAMDILNLPFQAVYGISGGLGLLCAYLFSQIRIHKERQTLRTLSENPTNIRLLSSLSILRSDKRFRRYMEWQMLNGFSTLIVEPGILVLIINDVFKSGWLAGGSALTAVQFMVAAFAGLLWAGVYDRNNIFDMRFYGAMNWAVSRFVLMLGVYYHSMEILLLSRVISGIAMGIGRLNWRLGHMEFAPPEKDSLYMGVHISLTGLRGIIAPFAGIYLFRLDCFGPSGIWLIALSGIGQAVAAFGFLSMRKQKEYLTTDCTDKKREYRKKKSKDF